MLSSSDRKSIVLTIQQSTRRLISAFHELMNYFSVKGGNLLRRRKQNPKFYLRTSLLFFKYRPVSSSMKSDISIHLPD